MGIVLVHEDGRRPVGPGHGVQCPLVPLPGFVLTNDQLDPTPPLAAKLLVTIHGHSSPERFGQNQDITNHGSVGDNVLLLRADGGGHTINQGLSSV